MDSDLVQKRINRNKIIVQGLEGHEPFKMLCEDLKKNIEVSDMNWHLINVDSPAKEGQASGKDLLTQLKYNKIAASTLINIVDQYKSEIERDEQLLYEIKNPDKVQTGYYDDE